MEVGGAWSAGGDSAAGSIGGFRATRACELEFTLRRGAGNDFEVGPDGGLCITLAHDATTGALERFIRPRRGAILDALARVARRGPLPCRGSCLDSHDGGVICFLGDPLRIEVRPTRTHPVERNGQHLRLCPRAQAVDPETFLRWWLYQRACCWLRQHVPTLARRARMPIPDVRIADIGARWTCWIDGDLCVHWRAFLLPRDIVEWLVLDGVLSAPASPTANALWPRFEAALPDCVPRLQWLARHGRGAGANG